MNNLGWINYLKNIKGFLDGTRMPRIKWVAVDLTITILWGKSVLIHSICGIHVPFHILEIVPFTWWSALADLNF